MRPPRGTPGGRPPRPGPGALKGRLSLARALSKFGVCSRREAERWIASGRVRVGGKLELWPARRIDPRRDEVTVDGRHVGDDGDRIAIALHKPVGYLTTRADATGRPTVYDLLGGVGRWVFPVGRLDKDSSGLLILTNDHRLGERVSSPESHVEKTYHALVEGVPDTRVLRALREGISLPDGTPTRPARVRPLGTCARGSWLEIVLTEGRNRQVRRMCAAVGHEVRELARVAIGALALGELAAGEWRLLTPDDRRALTTRARR